MRQAGEGTASHDGFLKFDSTIVNLMLADRERVAMKGFYFSTIV